MHPVVVGPVAQHPPQHWAGRGEGLGVLELEAEPEQGLGDPGEVRRVDGQQQIDDALAGQPRHRRAADMLGQGARPAGGDQDDQALGDLGGTWVCLVDFHRSPGVPADRRFGAGGNGPAGVRVPLAHAASSPFIKAIHGFIKRSTADLPRLGHPTACS
jgi:hypothetical protein